MSSYGAKGTRTPNNRLQRTVRFLARLPSFPACLPQDGQGQRRTTREARSVDVWMELDRRFAGQLVTRDMVKKLKLADPGWLTF
jgi:hypothetical protein